MTSEIPSSSNGFQRLARRTVYESDWLTVHIDKLRQPNGRVVDEFHIIDWTDATATILENDRGEILLTRVYRYAIDTVDWELPGGRVDPGEAPLEAGVREAFEETGYEAREARLLHSFYPNGGISNRRYHIAWARAGARTGEPDPNEIAETRWFSRDEIRQKMVRGEFRNGFTLTGLLLWMDR